MLYKKREKNSPVYTPKTFIMQQTRTQRVLPVPCCVLSGPWYKLRSELSALTHLTFYDFLVSLLVTTPALHSAWTAGLHLKSGLKVLFVQLK